jgi:hypothetical protein
MAETIRPQMLPSRLEGKMDTLQRKKEVNFVD